jgi:membrane protease YdiL (CAAX protease family)
MNFKTNIKITGFFQIIQSIFIVLIYNVLAMNVFPPESINNELTPGFLYIFSSQILGFLFTAFSLTLLYKIKIPDNFLDFDIKYRNVILMSLLFFSVNLIIGLYQISIVEIIPLYLIPSYLSMQSELMKGYSNLITLLTQYHPSLLYLVGGLLPAICEEFFFRGFLQNLALRYFSPISSIVMVSFIFALFHFQIVALIPLFIFGLALGYLSFKTERIIYSVILHFMNNVMTLYLISMS